MFDTSEDVVALFDEIDEFLKQPRKDEFILISEAELERLIMSLATVRGEEGFSEDELMSVVRWAEECRVGSSMLDLIFSGDADIDWNGTEVVIRATDQGKAKMHGQDI